MKFSTLLVSILFALPSFSQGPVSNACSSAQIICDGDLLPWNVGASPSPVIPDSSLVSNPFTNPNPGNSGCLLTGEINPNWFLIDIESSGSLAFSFSVSGAAGFFDWSMWPYDTNSCQMIAADSLAPIACNWNGTSAGMTGIADSSNLPATGNMVNFESPFNVVAGEQFIICITNGASMVGNVLFTNLGTAGLCQSTNDISENAFDPERELVKIIDMTGRIVKDQPNMVMIYIYNDGSSERVFRME